MTQNTYAAEVTYEDPWWVAIVEGVPGAAVETRRLDKLADEVRYGLATLLGVSPDSFDLAWKYDFPNGC